MSINNLQIKSVNDLIQEQPEFFIPSYQRGYRWTDREVTDLLDDIWEFACSGSDGMYCLQPIVVHTNGARCEVIDGQQRLTTIFLILKFLEPLIDADPKIFKIEYETRPDSGTFLQDIATGTGADNIDFHHINQAYQTIKSWFAETVKAGTSNVRIKFLNPFLEQTKVIWYEVNGDSDPIDIFTRINMGKILLTNAELIKALFLKKDNFKDDANLRLRQLEIAAEWDQIEYALGEDEFWFFLNDGKTIFASRIEFLLNMISVDINRKLPETAQVKAERNDFFAFMTFSQCFKQAELPPNVIKDSPMEYLWAKVKGYFMTLQEWFNDRKYYHLVGYLIAVGDDLHVIKNETAQLSKNDIDEYLRRKIKAHVNYQVRDLEYKHQGAIRNILLLFNIQTLLDNKNSGSRFQFDRFKSENWDIEHIHSVRSAIPETSKHQDDWMATFLKFTSEAEWIEKVSAHLKQEPKVRTKTFHQLYYDIVDLFTDQNDLEEINGISNLALLDSSTNRGYKNAVFPVKRKVILQRDKEGTFIPPATKNVFLKYYNGDVEHMSFWSPTDREEYENAIIGCLEKQQFIPTQKMKINL